MGEKTYLLRKYDEPVLSLRLVEDKFSSYIQAGAVLNEHLLPLYFKANGFSSETLNVWLSQRRIPGHRAFADDLLARLGLGRNDVMGVLEISRGLSLNDVYWITDLCFRGGFARYNLYENPFSEIVGQIAFTGYGSLVRPGFISSPELTTGGALAKCWRRIRGEIYLYKAGSDGFANSGMEPYSEYYAAQLAEFMGLPHAAYDLEMWKGKLCSVCPLFTGITTSYVPIGMLLPAHGEASVFRKILDYLDSTPISVREKVKETFADMLIFDALIENTDRHLGNWGVLVDNKTDHIIGPAPLYDHGYSLLYGALDSELADRIQKRIPTEPTPAFYKDFFQAAAAFARPRHRRMLRKLASFRFCPHRYYNVSEKRLKALNVFVRNRASMLLTAIREHDLSEREQKKSDAPDRESDFFL